MSDLLAHLPLTVATVRCGLEHHQLVWEGGELLTPAHADPEAELALMALGGEPCRCVQLLGHWMNSAADPRALILGPRERAEPNLEKAAQKPRVVPRRRPGVTRAIPGIRAPGGSIVMGGSASTSGPSSVSVSSRSISGPASTPAEPDEEDPLVALFQISDRLSRRLVATVTAALIEQDDPARRHALQAALHGRVLAGLTRWLGHRPELEVDVVPPDAPRSLTHIDGRVHASLPIRWIIDVWAADLTYVDGNFTLAATPRPGGGLTLHGVDEDLTRTSRAHPR